MGKALVVCQCRSGKNQGKGGGTIYVGGLQVECV